MKNDLTLPEQSNSTLLCSTVATVGFVEAISELEIIVRMTS